MILYLLEGQMLSNEVFICDISKSATEGVFTWMQHSLADELVAE